MRKQVAFIIALAAVTLLLVPGVAMANYSIHGGYSMDTDACAGCHRAHTAASSITWTRTDDATASALLLGTATEIYQFCYTCHDAVGLGADTNVEEGIYEGTLAGNTQFAPLNGGGFEGTLFPTQHMYTGSSWLIYGGKTDEDILGDLKDGPQIEMTCSTCHDVHGSANYRLLKDIVNGRTVGGYDDSVDPENPTPLPWVVSAEPGYPTMGWLLHEPGASQVSTYSPVYTEPMYAKAPGGDTTKGMSGWCAACHVQYLEPVGSEAGAYFDTSLNAGEGDPETLAWTPGLGYDSNDGFGAVLRHRHPVNVPLSNFAGVRSLIVTDQVLPLAHDGNADVATNEDTDWMECLTCHVAHGSNVTMEGYANVADATDPQPDSGTGGVPPTDGNALLRLDNRGVCETCHNK